MNAIGSYPVDRAAEAMGYKNTPSFGDRYHEIVDPTMEAINEYHEDKPVEAAGLELGAGVFNPANKVGVGFIKNGTSFANTTLRSGVVGSGIGGVAGAMNAERVEDVVPNAFGGSLSGAAIGSALPLATGIAGKMTRPLFATKKAPITIPAKEQLKAIKPQSKYNPNKKLTREEADALLRDRTAIQKLGIYNDELSYNDNAIDKRLGIQHLLGETRNPYIRTLNNTINKPDVKFTWDGREFNAKMYENGDTGKNFMDWIITEDGKLLIDGYPEEHISFFETIKDEESQITFPYVVEEGKYFVMNDYRLEKNDSQNASIFLDGKEIGNLPSGKREIGMVFQGGALFDNLRVVDNVAYGLVSRGEKKKVAREKASAFLKRFGLEGFEKRFPDTLSGGEAQRVSLARTLILRPKIVLFDEPLSALDAPLRKKLAVEILALKNEFGFSGILVTHDIEEARFLCSRVLLMKNGKIAWEGNASDFGIEKYET